VAVGSTVTWTYNVTNQGLEPIDNVVVTDDNGTPGDTSDDLSTLKSGSKQITYVSGDDGNGLLDPGETWVFTASAPAVAGQYENFGTVTGTSTDSNTPVTDTNVDHYYGDAPAIKIVKLTNGTDNDSPTGPHVAVGSTVT